MVLLLLFFTSTNYVYVVPDTIKLELNFVAGQEKENNLTQTHNKHTRQQQINKFVDATTDCFDWFFCASVDFIMLFQPHPAIAS